jgi:hypothetical protein
MYGLRRTAALYQIDAVLRFVLHSLHRAAHVTPLRQLGEIAATRRRYAVIKIKNKGGCLGYTAWHLR